MLRLLGALDVQGPGDFLRIPEVGVLQLGIYPERHPVAMGVQALDGVVRGLQPLMRTVLQFRKHGFEYLPDGLFVAVVAMLRGVAHECSFVVGFFFPLKKAMALNFFLLRNALMMPRSMGDMERSR